MAIRGALSHAVVYVLIPLSAILPLLLFGSSTGANKWLVAETRADIEFETRLNTTIFPASIYIPSNGRLGMQYFCPNTAPTYIARHFKETGKILDEKDIPPSPCYWMGPSCDITYCVYNDTADSSLGFCAKFDIFEPELLDDTKSDTIDAGLLAMYNLIQSFPGGGSCEAYRSTKWFHYFSFTCAILATCFTFGIMALFPIAKLMSKLQGVISICALGAGAMHALAFIFSIITLSVWGGSITNPGLPGPGFWLEVSACITVLFCVPIPFLVAVCELPECGRDDVEEKFDDVEEKWVQEMTENNTVTVPSTNSDAERLEKELKQVMMDRDSKAVELEKLQQEMGAKDAELESLREVIAAKDAQIASLSEELASVSMKDSASVSMKDSVTANEV